MRSSRRTSVMCSAKRGSSRVSESRGLRQVDWDDSGDPAGPRRHDDDAGREEDGFGDRVRDEDDSRKRLLPDPQQLVVHPLAGHLVEGAERLVHQQERRRERERPRDRDALLHPARELPGMVLLEAGQLDEVDHLADAGLAALAVPAGHLERQGDVLRHRAPVVEDGVLEDDPVVAVEPGPVRGLAVDQHVALARPDQVADDPQQRRLAAARRADQRDELARLDVEVDPVEREHVAALEALRQPGDRDGSGVCSCDVLRRAMDEQPLGERDDGEEDDPEQRRR